MTASTATPAQATPSPLAAVPRAVWITLGVLALASAGMAGALVSQSFGSGASATPAAVAQPATPSSLASTLAPIDGVPVQQAAPAAVQPAPKHIVATRPAPVHVAQAAPAVARAPIAPVTPAPVYSNAPVAPVVTQAPAPVPAYTQAEPVRAAICHSCGTVEAVHTVQQQGQGTGLGAVAGGVLGGVLGNQVGGGSGKKAMTVLGALGGAYGGHVVEQRMRGTTSYDVSVRMEDGSVRTVRQAQAIPVGTRVTTDGNTLRVANPSGGSSNYGNAGVPVIRTSTYQ